MTDTDPDPDTTPVPAGVAPDEETYADYTVDDAKAAVRDADASVADLQRIYEYEYATKERITLLDWLADTIRSRGGTVPDVHAPDDADADAETTDDDDGEAGEADDEAEADDDDEAAGAVEREHTRTTTQVAVRAPGTGYYGGHWFDNAGTETIEWDGRVEEAVRDGGLSLVAARHEDVIPADLRPGRDRRQR